MLYGICVRARRQVEAFVVLDQSGYRGEGSFLLRAALEHAVTAQWVYATVGGYEQFEVAAIRARNSYWEMFSDQDDPEIQKNVAYAREAAENVADQTGLPSRFTKDLLGRLDSNNYLTRTYRLLSQSGHVTHQAFEAIFSVGEDGNPQFSNVPEQDTPETGMWYFAAICCMLTDWVLVHVADDTDAMKEVERWADVLEMPFRLDWDLPDNERRFPDAFPDT
jgi:hypothetical protein